MRPRRAVLGGGYRLRLPRARLAVERENVSLVDSPRAKYEGGGLPTGTGTTNITEQSTRGRGEISLGIGVRAPKAQQYRLPVALVFFPDRNSAKHKTAVYAGDKYTTFVVNFATTYIYTAVMRIMLIDRMSHIILGVPTSAIYYPTKHTAHSLHLTSPVV